VGYLAARFDQAMMTSSCVRAQKYTWAPSSRLHSFQCELSLRLRNSQAFYDCASDAFCST
jgi:hypothetical protein